MWPHEWYVTQGVGHTCDQVEVPFKQMNTPHITSYCHYHQDPTSANSTCPCGYTLWQIFFFFYIKVCSDSSLQIYWVKLLGKIHGYKDFGMLKPRKSEFFFNSQRSWEYQWKILTIEKEAYSKKNHIQSHIHGKGSSNHERPWPWEKKHVAPTRREVAFMRKKHASMVRQAPTWERSLFF